MAPVSVPSDQSNEEIWQSQTFTGFLALNAAVVFGIVLWDYFFPKNGVCMKPEEEENGVPLPPGPLASTLCNMIYSSVTLSNCQNVVSVGQGASVVVFASAGVILCSRVGGFWEFQRIPLAMVFIPCIMMVCAWMAFAAQFRATTGPALPFGTNCKFVPLQIWTPVSYATTAAFNLIVSALAVTRVFTKPTIVAMNTGLTLINRACILYLVCATLPSIVIACLFSIHWPTELLKRAAGSYLVLIMMSMGSRIFLNLQLHHQMLTRVAESNHFTSPTWTPPNPEKVISNPKPPADEPEFEPALTMLSVPESDVLSVDRYTTRTALTVPETPATLTSFSGSTIYSQSSYGNPISPSRSRQGSQRSILRAGSIKSSSSGSTRVTYATPTRSPPRSERVGSVRSVETGSTRRTDTTPRSPRNGPSRVGSVRSVGTNSTRLTGHRSNRRVRMANLNSFATTSKLPSENLKSTWHGV
ncbi:hypothetical protein CVT26_013018 [Gymnopilus dilepis]|uniref:Uncharacterized protein n=1 Tax=Gymnopilus dilepis TaxID=231916 RepID=A0A409Y4C2_9AGAR|nr:hypothetical protein CVT26_013018 [Gymnopilus dilepis]